MKIVLAFASLVVLTTILSSANGAAAGSLKKVAGESKQLFGAFGATRNYCPLCDSSVYSYCHQKVYHDGCCCNGQFGVQGSYQCLHADCSYLHANSCREYALIAECCCDD